MAVFSHKSHLNSVGRVLALSFCLQPGYFRSYSRAHCSYISSAGRQHLRGLALRFAKEAKEKVFSLDMTTRHALRFFSSVRQNRFSLVGYGKVHAGRNALPSRIYSRKALTQLGIVCA